MRQGEAAAWIFGLVGLLGLAIPLALFSDLSIMCAVSDQGRRSTSRADRESSSEAATIVWIELAGLRGGVDRANAVYQAYEANGRLGCARKAVAADTIFLTMYASALTLATMLLARTWSLHNAPRLGTAIRGLALVVLTAAVLDVIENFGLLRLLDSPARLDLARPIAIAASVKFILLGLVLTVLGITSVPLLLRARRAYWSLVALSLVVGGSCLTLAVGLGYTVWQALQTMPGGS